MFNKLYVAQPLTSLQRCLMVIALGILLSTLTSCDTNYSYHDEAVNDKEIGQSPLTEQTRHLMDEASELLADNLKILSHRQYILKAPVQRILLPPPALAAFKATERKWHERAVELTEEEMVKYEAAFDEVFQVIKKKSLDYFIMSFKIDWEKDFKNMRWDVASLRLFQEKQGDIKAMITDENTVEEVVLIKIFQELDGVIEDPLMRRIAMEEAVVHMLKQGSDTDKRLAERIQPGLQAFAEKEKKLFERLEKGLKNSIERTRDEVFQEPGKAKELLPLVEKHLIAALKKIPKRLEGIKEEMPVIMLEKEERLEVLQERVFAAVIAELAEKRLEPEIEKEKFKAVEYQIRRCNNRKEELAEERKEILAERTLQWNEAQTQLPINKQQATERYYAACQQLAAAFPDHQEAFKQLREIWKVQTDEKLTPAEKRRQVDQLEKEFDIIIEAAPELEQQLLDAHVDRALGKLKELANREAEIKALEDRPEVEDNVEEAEEEVKDETLEVDEIQKKQQVEEELEIDEIQEKKKVEEELKVDQVEEHEKKKEGNVDKLRRMFSKRSKNETQRGAPRVSSAPVKKSKKMY